MDHVCVRKVFADASLPTFSLQYQTSSIERLLSNATYYQWKSKYSGVQVSELQRLRELEAENAKLKRMYADLALENSAIKDVLNRKS
ncbi:hypothetical protein EC609_04755 [Achromobacter denitrificans]|nr:hypothetical protein EC609_04755 [Achromobacter denitrificans]